MNLIAQLPDAAAAFLVILLGLFGIYIFILALLMPLFIYLIYKQGVRNQKTFDAYERGFNMVIERLDRLASVIRQGDSPTSAD